MSNIQVKKDALKLFDFVKAFHELKFKTRFNINELKKIYLNQVPAVHDYIKVGAKYVDRLMQWNYSPDEREDVILSVRYAEMSRPPQVPDVLQGWLSYNVNDFHGKPSHYEFKYPVENESGQNDVESKAQVDSTKEEIPCEYFTDEHMRVVAYDGYVKVWDDWKKRESEKEPVRNIYTKLRELQAEIEANDATQELVLGNGILTQTRQDLFYPIVTQHITISFDTKKNEVTVYDSGDKIRVEALALQQLTGVENINIEKSGLQNIYPLDVKTLFETLQEVALKLTIRPVSGVRLRFDEKLAGKSILFTMQPVFFIRPRTRAVGRLVDDLKEHIENGDVEVNAFLTQALSNVPTVTTEDHAEEFSLEETLARSCGESKEILFTKPANREQLEIAEKIEKNGVVVVQGPPGTGKTHTIANLIGHFLSQGKTVLVTSEKGKALSVLKGQVEKQLQPLCMYLNGDNKNEAIHSVQKIQEYRTTHNTNVIKKEIDKYTQERVQEINAISRIRRLIYQIRNKQVESISYGGKTYSPIDAAQFITENVGVLDYIPGPVEYFNAFPLRQEDLKFLYETNETVSADDETHLSKGYPKVEKLLEPAQFEELLQKRSYWEKELQQQEQLISENLTWKKEQLEIVDKNGKILLCEANESAISELKALLAASTADGQLCPWMERIILDSIKGEEYQKLWKDLITKITVASKYYEGHCVGLAKKNIKIDEKFFSLEQPLQLLEAAIEKMDDHGKFGFWNNLFGNKYKEVCACISMAGQVISNKSGYKEALVWAHFMELARLAGSLWNQMMKDDSSVPTYEMLVEKFDNPLEPMMKVVPDMNKGLAYDTRYVKLMTLVREAGFLVKNVVDYGQWDDNDTTIRHEIQFLQKKLPVLLSCYDVWHEIDSIDETLGKYKDYLLSISVKNKAWKKFYSVFANENIGEYRKQYEDLVQLIQKEAQYVRRKNLLDELHKVAPEWSRAIQERKGILGGVRAPETIYDAWKWKQLEKHINEINGVTVEKLEKDLAVASKALLHSTVNLCEAKAWYCICKKINQNPKLTKALASWQLAIKKLGKGKSKNADIYKQQVRAAMAECQCAIPVWIMPFYMTYDFLKVGQNHFDIIIVDEASQSDITAVATLPLADKVIVVGDDKQVSPTNMKISTEEVEKLRKLYLGKDFPKEVYQVMDIGNSLYDLASQQSQSILLTEHFRCVPNIIGYSNWLSYAGQIKPLRPADSTTLKPAMVSCFVGGHRDDKNKINQREAEYIVALILACCKNSAYKNQTFGVISLLGNQQADLINQLIAEKISLKEKDRHQIVCGDAAQFQGDERDVIFLSMVDSAENGPLTFRAMDQSVYQQRYNVAVSRAKNQVWIVHSLHKNTDLKIQNNMYDIRRSLLEYAANPASFMDDKGIREKADSPFEVEVCQYLSAHGYQYVQQYPAGAYYIDIAMKGKKVAIECDGDRWHSTAQQVSNDMERQTILERLGWQFIRIRGTQYYRDKDGTMKLVLARLQALQVVPQGVETVTTIDAVTETVKTDAEKYVSKWRNGEDTNSYFEENIDNSTEEEKTDEVTDLESTSSMTVGETVKTYGANSHYDTDWNEENSVPTEISLFGHDDAGSEVPYSTTSTVKKRKPKDTHTKKPVYQGTIEIGRPHGTIKEDVPKETKPKEVRPDYKDNHYWEEKSL